MVSSTPQPTGPINFEIGPDGFARLKSESIPAVIDDPAKPVDNLNFMVQLGLETAIQTRMRLNLLDVLASGGMFGESRTFDFNEVEYTQYRNAKLAYAQMIGHLAGYQMADTSENWVEVVNRLSDEATQHGLNLIPTIIG